MASYKKNSVKKVIPRESSPKLIELLLKHRGENRGREFSRARGLKVLVDKKIVKSSLVTRKFLAVSPVFMRKYSKVISSASHLISSNYKKLLMGEIINEKGFVIKKESTGKSHKGTNTYLALNVSFKEKVFFVKIGSDCGERNFLAYQKANAFFKDIGNEFNGFRIESVPYHLLYQKSSFTGKLRGFLVSDFFPQSKVTLVLDIERSLGEERFFKTRLGSTLDSLRTKMNEKGFRDNGPHNCFFDEVKNTIYFFDLQLNK